MIYPRPIGIIWTLLKIYHLRIEQYQIMMVKHNIDDVLSDDFKFDDEEVQVTKVVSGKEKTKKGKEEKKEKETKAMEDDDTDGERVSLMNQVDSRC